MIRARFRVYAEDSRPVEWPIKHPYWVTGYGDGYDILVAYADDEAEILRLWPEAEQIDADPAESYKFTDRFYEPEWFKAQRTTTQDTRP